MSDPRSNVFSNFVEVSAQEAVYLYLQMPLTKCTSDTVFINTSVPEERMFLLKQKAVLDELRPYIDSEINHIRHFIKIPFINKGIDFIDLPSIFRDNTVESSIPDYFENREPPIICYKYNKPIRSTIFNFNKLVATLDIDT